MEPNFFEKIKFKLEDLNRFLFTDVPDFFKNIWKFRKELWHHVDFDYESSLRFLRRNIQLIYAAKIDDYEDEEDKRKKLKSMNTALLLLDNIIQDDYITIAQNQLGKKLSYNTVLRTDANKWYLPVSTKDREIFDKARELEQLEWEELFNILKGPNGKEEYKETDKDALPKLKNGNGLYKWWC
jgi:hypothetical protein